NSVNATTLAVGTNCGNENFETIPASASTYATYNWTSNGISWTSTDSRTDQMLNARAITIRNGSLTALSAPNGIGDLTVTTNLVFTGTAGNFSVFINDVDTGLKIPYGATGVTTTTQLKGINISGTVDIKLVNNSTSNRVIVDDMIWTCYATAATSEVGKNKNAITIYPNPVKNRELNISGQNLSEIETVQIFDFSGKLVQTIEKPFKYSNKLSLKNLPKGVYILKAGTKSAKFIID
ncbi:MAG: T9SS type A sorting domain-containing protein, partial [Chryseobacterium sp.]|nr:T9SS type A sorting domain-containing protein [Chryseobacterium sp.]